MNSSEQLSKYLSQAILLEVATAPKPGLVTRHSNGAHRDMSLLTFAMSSAVAANAFFASGRIGSAHGGSLPELFQALRRYGIEAEKELLQSTKGVNTQRGILFAGCLLAGAAGYLEQEGQELTVRNVCRTVAAMTAGLVDRELKSLKQEAAVTAGEKLYVRYHITGIRGEAEKGFPSVMTHGLPGLRDAFKNGATLNDACVHALLSLMTVVEDSNVVWRTDYESLLWLRERAEQVFSLGSIYTGKGYEAIRELDHDCIERRISPGGCADLLSVTLALYLLENKEFPTKVM